MDYVEYDELGKKVDPTKKHRSLEARRRRNKMKKGEEHGHFEAWRCVEALDCCSALSQCFQGYAGAW